MSRDQFSRSSDQDSSPRKKTRTMYSDSSDEELGFLSRRRVSQSRRKRFNSGSRSDILTQLQRQLLSPDELAHRRGGNTRNVLNRIEEEPEGREYNGEGKKVVSSRRHPDSIQSSPYHLPSHSQEHEDIFRRPLSRLQREAESLSRGPSHSSLREFQYDRENNGWTSLESRDMEVLEFCPAGVLLCAGKSTNMRLVYLNTIRYHGTEPGLNLPIVEVSTRDRRELSQWPRCSSLRELPNDERLRSLEFRSEVERRVQPLYRWPSCTSVRDLQYEDKPSSTHSVREQRSENEHREQPLSRWPSSTSVRNMHYEDNPSSAHTVREHRYGDERREQPFSRWPSNTSVRDLQYKDKPSSTHSVREHRSENEHREQPLSRWPSSTSVRNMHYEDNPSSAHTVREHRSENERREQPLSRWPSSTSVRNMHYEDNPSSAHTVREHRTDDESRVQSLSRWPSRTSVRDIQYGDKPGSAPAVREHSVRMDEELRPRRREYRSDLDYREDLSYSKRKELLQRIQPLRGSSQNRIQQLSSSHQSSSVLRDSVPFSCTLPRSQEERTRNPLPHTVWSSDSDSSEPGIVKESSQAMRQDPRTLILPEDIAASQSQDRSPSPSILRTEGLQHYESVQSGSSLRSIGVQTEEQLLSSPARNRISPTDSDSSLPETPPHSKRRKKSSKARTTTDAQPVMNNVSSSPTKQRNKRERIRYSTRLKNRPEAVRKSILSNRSTFPTDRIEYTDEERKQIVAYIVQNGIHEFVKGNTIWKAMFVDKVCERSWQSMKAQFLKSILPNIEKYDLSSEELLKFKKCDQQPRINKDAKGKVVPGHRGWRRNGHYYTVEDDKKMLEFITTKGRHQQTSGVKLWKMMELRGVLPERSWQSMKERYRKVILPNLKRYELSKDDYAKLMGLTRKGTNTKTSTIPTAVRSVALPNKKHQLHTRGHSPCVNQTYGDDAESMTGSFESISSSSTNSATRGGNMISTPTRKAFQALYEKAGNKLSSLSDKPVSNTLSEKPERTSPVKSTVDLNTVCSTPIRSPVPTIANMPSNQMNSFVEPSPSNSEGEKAMTPENPHPALGEVSPYFVSDERKTSSHNNDNNNLGIPTQEEGEVRELVAEGSDKVQMPKCVDTTSRPNCDKKSCLKLNSKQPQSCGDLLPIEHSPVVVEKGNTSKHDLQLTVSVNVSDSNTNLVSCQNISPCISEASTVINENFNHEECHFSQITSHQVSNNLDIPTQEEGEGRELVAEGSDKVQMPKCVDTTSRSNCGKKSNVPCPPKRKEGTSEERKKKKEWMRRMIMRQKIVMSPIRPPFLRRNLLGGNKNVTKNDGKQNDVKKRKKEKNNHVNDGKILFGDERAVTVKSKGSKNEIGKTCSGSKVVPKMRSVNGKLKKSAVQNGNHSKRRKILAGDLTKSQNKQVVNESNQGIAESVTRATSEEGENRTVQPVETNQPLEEPELPPCLNNEQELLHIPDMEDGGAAANLCESSAVHTNLEPLEECSPLAGSSSSPNSFPWGCVRPSENEQIEVRSCLEYNDSVNTEMIGKCYEKKKVFISESSESSSMLPDEEWDIRTADRVSQTVRETIPEINTQIISVCGTQIIDVCSTQNIDTFQVDGDRMQLCSTCLASERGSDAEGVVLPSLSCDHQLQESPGDSGGEDEHQLQKSHGDSGGEDEHQLQESPGGSDGEDEHQLQESPGDSGGEDDHHLQESDEGSGSEDEHQLQKSHGDSGGEDEYQLQESPGDSDCEDDQQLQESPGNSDGEDGQRSVVLPGGVSMSYLSTIQPRQSYRTHLANSFVKERNKEQVDSNEIPETSGRLYVGPSGDKDLKTMSNQCSVS